jgi:hypothetical protein
VVFLRKKAPASVTKILEEHERLLDRLELRVRFLEAETLAYTVKVKSELGERDK